MVGFRDSLDGKDGGFANGFGTIRKLFQS